MRFRSSCWHRALLALAVLSLAALALAARGQEPALRGGKVLLENEHVQVVEGVLAPGEAAGVHKHVLAGVVICLEGATLQERFPDGSTKSVERKPGEVWWREKDFTHDEANTGKTRLRVIAVQLKR